MKIDEIGEYLEHQGFSDEEIDDFLEHFGVKGMRWGVRKDKVVGTDGGVSVTKGDAKWKKEISTTKAYLKVHNQIAESMNRDLPAFNKKYEGKNIGYDPATQTYKTAIGKQYLKEYEGMATRHAETAVADIFGNSPSGNWTTKASYSVDYGLSVSIEPAKVSHSISETENGYIVYLDVTLDNNGLFLPIKKETESSMSQSEVDGILHFGVKGMKWGVRKDRAPGASRATDREARKDAQETARAKMFYGQGAGTRRKLINASVDAKSKKDPAYAKAFEYHINKQDMSTHSEKARSERSSIDRRTKNKQRAGYIARRLTGEMGTQAAFTAAITAGVIYMNSPRARAFTKTNINIAKNWVANKRNSAVVQNFFKNQGFT